MPNKPLFVIIVPSYNQGHFIQQTIDSILRQEEVLVKVVVMDGGSSDDTVAILKQYDRRIQWVSKKDHGQSDAINKGLLKVFAEHRNHDNVFVTYLNSDDYYQPQALSRAARAFSEHPNRHWVVGECEIVDSEGRPIQEWIKAYKKMWRSVLNWQVLCVLNPIPQPAVVMRLSAVKSVGLFNQNLRYTMDYEYWLRMWQKWGAPQQISELVASFRIHGQSKGSTQFYRQFAEQHEVAQRQGVSPAWLFCQSMHNKLITGLYSVIK